jgi:hypothetical protein
MSETTLANLQASIQDRTAFGELADYFTLAYTFLDFVQQNRPTRVISPTHHHYIFFQYDQAYGHRITRPLNSHLLIELPSVFQIAAERFFAFLADLKKWQHLIVDHAASQPYLASQEVVKVVYTIQQAIGSISDSFANPNQSRKRVGQLFESFVKLLIQQVGLECEPRTVTIPIPDQPGYIMPYQLDLVFSRGKVILAAETRFIGETEIVGSVKTTSKDRIDKVFLDKYLLTKLLGRNIPVVAIFLHDVQRANRGNSIFGVNSTFKSNHFLGYTVALNRLDGVYYVDLRPEMLTNERLREQIRDFQTFLVQDLWLLTSNRT